MTYLHVFPFSLRTDTPAERLPEHLSPQIKNRRSRHLIQLGEQKRLDFHRRFLGEELEVLVEDRRDKATGLATGMSDNYIKVLFAAPSEAANRILKVSVSRAREDLVFGECGLG
jgi:threonylcarbamoyladenosine tRNA methylthiotransferase MtaB